MRLPQTNKKKARANAPAVTIDTVQDPAEALSQGVQAEERGERYLNAPDDSSLKAYTKSAQWYERAFNLAEAQVVSSTNDSITTKNHLVQTADAAFNCGRTLFILATQFYYPPSSLQHLENSITSYSKALEWHQKAVQRAQATSGTAASASVVSLHAFGFDIEYNRAIARQAMAEMIAGINPVTTESPSNNQQATKTAQALLQDAANGFRTVSIGYCDVFTSRVSEVNSNADQKVLEEETDSQGDIHLDGEDDDGEADGQLAYLSTDSDVETIIDALDSFGACVRSWISVDEENAPTSTEAANQKVQEIEQTLQVLQDTVQSSVVRLAQSLPFVADNKKQQIRSLERWQQIWAWERLASRLHYACTMAESSDLARAAEIQEATKFGEMTDMGRIHKFDDGIQVFKTMISSCFQSFKHSNVLSSTEIWQSNEVPADEAFMWTSQHASLAFDFTHLWSRAAHIFMGWKIDGNPNPFTLYSECAEECAAFSQVEYLEAQKILQSTTSRTPTTLSVAGSAPRDDSQGAIFTTLAEILLFQGQMILIRSDKHYLKAPAEWQTRNVTLEQAHNYARRAVTSFGNTWALNAYDSFSSGTALRPPRRMRNNDGDANSIWNATLEDAESILLCVRTCWTLLDAYVQYIHRQQLSAFPMADLEKADPEPYVKEIHSLSLAAWTLVHSSTLTSDIRHAWQIALSGERYYQEEIIESGLIPTGVLIPLKHRGKADQLQQQFWVQWSAAMSGNEQQWRPWLSVEQMLSLYSTAH